MRVPQDLMVVVASAGMPQLLNLQVRAIRAFLSPSARVLVVDDSRSRRHYSNQGTWNTPREIKRVCEITGSEYRRVPQILHLARRRQFPATTHPWVLDPRYAPRTAFNSHGVSSRSPRRVHWSCWTQTCSRYSLPLPPNTLRGPVSLSFRKHVPLPKVLWSTPGREFWWWIVGQCPTGRPCHGIARRLMVWHWIRVVPYRPGSSLIEGTRGTSPDCIATRGAGQRILRTLITTFTLSLIWTPN